MIFQNQRFLQSLKLGKKNLEQRLNEINKLDGEINQYNEMINKLNPKEKINLGTYHELKALFIDSGVKISGVIGKNLDYFDQHSMIADRFVLKGDNSEQKAGLVYLGFLIPAARDFKGTKEKINNLGDILIQHIRKHGINIKKLGYEPKGRKEKANYWRSRNNYKEILEYAYRSLLYGLISIAITKIAIAEAGEKKKLLMPSLVSKFSKLTWEGDTHPLDLSEDLQQGYQKLMMFMEMSELAKKTAKWYGKTFGKC